MTRYAIITDGTVENVVKADADLAAANGWIEAPSEVGPGWGYDGSTWTEPAPEPGTVEQVKAEAYRRIIAFIPEWKQRNLIAQASILAEKGRANWTADELAAWNAGEAVWSHVAAIRAASDALEAADPIPADFTADTHWP